MFTSSGSSSVTSDTPLLSTCHFKSLNTLSGDIIKPSQSRQDRFSERVYLILTSLARLSSFYREITVAILPVPSACSVNMESALSQRPARSLKISGQNIFYGFIHLIIVTVVSLPTFFYIFHAGHPSHFNSNV